MVVRQDSQARDVDRDDEVDRLDSGQQGFEALKASGGFDAILAKIHAGELQLTGEGGMVQEIVKAVLERGLSKRAHQQISATTRGSGWEDTSSARNGFSAKTCL